MPWKFTKEGDYVFGVPAQIGDTEWYISTSEDKTEALREFALKFGFDDLEALSTYKANDFYTSQPPGPDDDEAVWAKSTDGDYLHEFCIDEDGGGCNDFHCEWLIERV